MSPFKRRPGFSGSRVSFPTYGVFYLLGALFIALLVITKCV